MATVLNLTRWERFKLRRRWMPWILLGIIVLIAQGTLWGTYISYRTTDLSLTMVSDSNPGGGYSSSLRCSDFEAGHVLFPAGGDGRGCLLRTDRATPRSLREPG